MGKTNRQLWDEFGMALGGSVAPASAQTSPRILGLIGDTRVTSARIDQVGSAYTNKLDNYRAVYYDANGRTTYDTTPITLKEGWNLVPRVINGARKMFLVYGDVTPPTFVPDPKYSFTIRQADLNTGFVLAGNRIDNSWPPERVGLVWRGLETQPTYTRPDGSRYLVVTYRFSDRAGNVAVVDFNVTII